MWLIKERNEMQHTKWLTDKETGEENGTSATRRVAATFQVPRPLSVHLLTKKIRTIADVKKGWSIRHSLMQRRLVPDFKDGWSLQRKFAHHAFLEPFSVRRGGADEN